MYRPEDLPGGRRPYHGRNELIASNDMAILHARTVDGAADVIQWKEDPETEELLDPQRLFWRQTLDVTLKPAQLSTLPTHCVDKAPWNPDEPLIQCASCRSWLHASCLEQDVLEKLYEEHKLAFPKKLQGKKGAKKAQPDSSFEVQVVVREDGQTRMNITDKRDGPTLNKVTTKHVYCLFCKSDVDRGNAASKVPTSGGIHVNSTLPTPATPSNQPDDENSDNDLDGPTATNSSPVLTGGLQGEPLGRDLPKP